MTDVTIAGTPPAVAGSSPALHAGASLSRGKGRWVLAAAIALGLTAVFSSSSYMAQFPHGTVVLPWGFPLATILSFIGSGLLLGCFVLIRPNYYWATLVSATVLTAGMFVLRFSFYDEWLAVAISAGGALACALKRVPLRRSNVRAGWAALFVGLCVYLLIEAVVGLWLYGNLKVLRYVITYSALLVIGWTVARYDFPRPGARQITMLVGLTGLAYYALVLLHGAVFPQYAWEVTLEGIGGAGSSHESVAGVVAVPAAVMLIGDRDGWRKLFGVVVLILALLIALFGDARAGMLCILVALLVAPFAIRGRVAATLWASAAGGSFLIGALVLGRSEWILNIARAMIEAANVQSGAVESEYFGRIVMHAQGDAGRAFYAKGGVETLLNEGPRVALMGTGMYGYFPVAGKHYEAAARRAGIPTYSINLGSAVGGVQEPPRPPSLGVLIAETGLIGLTLFGGCAFLAIVASSARRQTRGKRVRIAWRENLLVASAVLLAVTWTYFGDATETVFFFLLLMPYGIVHSWGQVDLEDHRSALRITR
ncbi:MAG: hypothetical protein ACT4P6_02480 [Gemmatimonadaceae bacterium]